MGVLIGMLCFMVSKDGLDNIILILKTTDYGWFSLGLLLMFAEISLDSLILLFPYKKSGRSVKFIEILKSCYIGRFFSYITPFNSGGQPVQAYYLSKKGASLSKTISILIIKYIVYQAALLSWGLILFLINSRFFFSIFEKYIWLIILGILINLIVTVFSIVTGRHSLIVSNIITFFIDRLSLIHMGEKHLIKYPDKIKTKVYTSISNYGKQFNETSYSKITLLKMYLVSMLQAFSYLAMTFVIYRALGNQGASIIDIITIQIFLFLIIAYIPTPGSGLGAESIFALFYYNIFVSNLNMANLFWRIFTFYIPFVIGGIIVISVKRSDNI